MTIFVCCDNLEYMEKTSGINYRTRRRLITTSIVIKTLLAFLVLFAFFYMIANIDVLRFYYALIMTMVDPSFEATMANINEIFISICITLPIVVIIIFTVIAYNLFWFIKSKQVFFRSKKQIFVFQFVNCLTFLIMPISGIFMLIAAYMKDDGMPTRISKRKQQKLMQNQQQESKPPKLTKQAKKQIKELKSQKRKGIISQEKYEKQLAKIKKNDATNNK